MKISKMLQFAGLSLLFLAGASAAAVPMPPVLEGAANQGGQTFDYIGVPYPTEALPGISGNPSAIPIMPTLPNGAHHTGSDWFFANANSYDPVTIDTPSAPASVTAGEYVVNKFHPSATDVDRGDNAISGTVYGTTSRPRVTLPDIHSGSVPAGTKVFVYGDGTPRPKAYNDNRKKDYTRWDNDDWTVRGTAASPVWIIGIDNPRLAARETQITGSSHLIVDGIIFDATDDAFGASFDIFTSDHMTFRNSAFYGNNKNGLMDVNSVTYFMFYNNEVAYTGYGHTGTYAPFSGVDRHGVRPLYGGRYIWFINNRIHSVSGDALQAGNSSNSRPQSESSHFVFFAGNRAYHCGENAIDNKNSYHVILSENDFFDFKPAYNADGGTAVILSNNDEGPWTGYHWAIANKVHDAENGIRDSSDQDGETNYVIGNVLWNIRNGALREQDSNGANNETVYWAFNTIYQAGRTYIRSRQQKSYTGYFMGNISYSPVYSHIASAGASTTDNDGDERLHVSDNLFYGNTAGFPSSGSFASWSNNVVGDSSADDPNFVDGANQNFQLNSESPAVNKVQMTPEPFQDFQSLYGKSIAIDYLGTARPSGGAWNLGATE